MNKTELQTLLNTRSGTERKVYEALRTHGKMTDRQLRDLLGSPGSGPRDALARLLPLGLVRHAGKAATKNNPMQWEVTPPAEIEEQQKRYETLKPEERAKRRRRSPGARLADLRQMESGDAREWHQVRDKLLAVLPLLTSTVRMSFWESVPPAELELAVEEVEELHVATANALEAGRERLRHEKQKEKIEKIERMEGRTGPERDAYARKADNLRQKLIPS
jgi:hypothetical protein